MYFAEWSVPFRLCRWVGPRLWRAAFWLLVEQRIGPPWKAIVYRSFQLGFWLALRGSTLREIVVANTAYRTHPATADYIRWPAAAGVRNGMQQT